LEPNAFLSTLFSNTFSLCCSFNVTAITPISKHRQNYNSLYLVLSDSKYQEKNSRKQTFPRNQSPYNLFLFVVIFCSCFYFKIFYCHRIHRL
jgi:hypothetical protein